jgi:multimeric flavodoxin WrbA
MKVIAINASPRKGGNTETLINKVLEPMKDAGWETEIIQIGGKPIRGCMACYKCMENKDMQCVIKTDLINEILPKLAEVDALILGTPVFYSNVTSEMKAFMDRIGFLSLANGYLFKGKVGAPVIAVRRSGAIPAFDAVNHFLHHQQFVMSGSTYWNHGIGLTPGDVEGDKEGMDNMTHLGKAIDWLARATKPVRDSFPE